MCMPIHNVTSNHICKKCDIKIVLALKGCRLLVPFVKTPFCFPLSSTGNAACLRNGL